MASRFRLLVALTLFAPLVASTARQVHAQNGSADWPQLRGPTARGISTAKGLPTKWSATENIAWKTDLPGAGASTPIVAGGKIYLTCYRGYNVPGEGGGSQEDLERLLVCISPKDGKVLWEKTVPTKLPEQDTIREEHGYASGTPVADEANIYCFFGKSGVFAFDRDGNQKWHAEVGSGIDGWGSAGPLTLHGNLLLVNAWVESGSLIALDKKSGKEVWRATVDQAWHPPLVVSLAGGKSELIVGMANKIVGFDPASGKELWTCDWKNYWYKVPIPTEANGVVYAIGGRDGDTALAVRAGGRGDVTDTHLVWTSTTGSNVSSPIYHDGHLYYASDSQAIAYCANAKTGEIKYEQRLPRANQIYSAALLAGGNIYYLDRSGTCFVVAAKPTFELVATNALGSREERVTFNSSPAVLGSKLLIRSDKALWCIGEK
ncbi:MAG TPA: PQQ-binding-like beta-propeller repeat protein [Pirellulaceae bacterium]|nr:PQQ-binding-like beta-propeller repeat protein [Pirellulaceae bacterium]